MSEGGGTGITTLVVLQSLAQARSRWGQHEAEAIWDSAIVKIVLGGSGNADDLRDLSALIGTREHHQINTTWGHDGTRSFSTSTLDKPILEPGQLRTLPFGHAVLLLRSAPPIMMRLHAWTDRADGDVLAAARDQREAAIRTAAAAAPHPTGQHADHSTPSAARVMRPPRPGSRRAARRLQPWRLCGHDLHDASYPRRRRAGEQAERGPLRRPPLCAHLLVPLPPTRHGAAA